MEGYRSRMIVEFKDLCVKISSADNYLKSWLPGTREDHTNCYLLDAQLNAMKAYRDILRLRIFLSSEEGDEDV